MDEVTANMAELSGHVSALAGLARGISAGLGAPLLRVSAFAYGVRRAVALRRPGRVAATARGSRRRRPAGRQTRGRRAASRAARRARPARREEARRLIRRLFWMIVGAPARA